MANLSKIKRDKMIVYLNKLKELHNDDESIVALNEIENFLLNKKFGLIFEEHNEYVDLMLQENIAVFNEEKEMRLITDNKRPINFIVEGDNLQALYLLEKTHRSRIDCIYIDPPYNTGAHDWKYNNDYVDGTDGYRHSKWLSMMKRRLEVAKRLLNPLDSVLICSIDEKEYLHLGCLLEEMFPTAKMQMISTVINVKGVARESEFSRVNEYLFIVQLGKCAVQKLHLSTEWMGNIKSSGKDKVRLAGLMRTGTGSHREDSPGCFYPIYFDSLNAFIRVGEALPVGVDRHTVLHSEDEYPVWPIHKDGSEGRWMYRPEGLRELVSKGYVFFGKRKGETMGISYAPKGVQDKIAKGLFKISGYNDDGSIIIDDSDYEALYIPGNQWAIASHNATEYGTKLLTNIIGEKRFDFPKSLYAVEDALKFFLNDKKDAVVLDFFAGSGTTFHAVNLLNKKDGGNRRCIMVTNNEISEKEEKRLTGLGFNKGDPEWESLGIAQYVNWPRTVCSITGKNVFGKEIPGNYLDTDIKMSSGFEANVKYLKCDWMPRKPTDYLLSNALCLHIKEMLEIQNFIEIDNKENILVLNKNDFVNYVSNGEATSIKNIWVNQNIIFTSNELNLLKKLRYKTIPKEFFGEELKEAGE